MSRIKERYELVEAVCGFWFHDHGHVRSPFPAAIRPQLEERAQREYLRWLRNLTETDRAEVSDDELVTVFEQILFAAAVELVDGDDEQVMTIHYPFLPRVGDRVDDARHGPSEVVRRRLAENGDEQLCMVLTMRSEATGRAWRAELPLQPAS